VHVVEEFGIGDEVWARFLWKSDAHLCPGEECFHEPAVQFHKGSSVIGVHEALDGDCARVGAMGYVPELSNSQCNLVRYVWWLER